MKKIYVNSLGAVHTEEYGEFKTRREPCMSLLDTVPRM